MLVKNFDRSNHIKHLEEAFTLLRKFNVNLNPEKCTFRVAFGKFFSGESKQTPIRYSLY